VFREPLGDVLPARRSRALRSSRSWTAPRAAPAAAPAAPFGVGDAPLRALRRRLHAGARDEARRPAPAASREPGTGQRPLSRPTSRRHFAPAHGAGPR